MAFDSGMLAAVAHEIRTRASGARVDKINQPEKAEMLFSLRSEKENLKLCVSASSGSPRICFEEAPKENPKLPPSLCMAFRKHLSGSRLITAELMGFERVVRFTFAARDELGYISEKYLYAEIMGRSSGFILCNDKNKVITASRFVDLSAAVQRKILPGISYELPPKQDKLDPMSESREGFLSRLEKASAEASAEAYIRNSYMGISPLIAREIVFSASGKSDAALGECNAERLWFYFSAVMDLIKSCDFTPTLIKDKNGKNLDFTFMEIRQYGDGAVTEKKESVSALIEEFFAGKNKAETAKHYAHDLFTVAKNVQSRLAKKLIALENELAECKKKDGFKLYGDLITANIYKVQKGDTVLVCENWYDEDCPEIKIPLDIRLTPAQNAQSYYKKYAKLKTGEQFKTEQIERAKAELDYMETVLDSLERAQTDDDYSYIREELQAGGYIKKSNVTPGRKPRANLPEKMHLASGRTVYCGKNNYQNDLLDSKIAGKHDYWFHVKNYPGSHVIMLCEAGEDPDERDFTDAAMLAAYNSKVRGSKNVAVDYTLVKNLKKPAGSPPGFVTYLTNYTAYVDAELPEGLS